MQEQWDLGAGEDSVVSFQEAVKGHAKKAGVCRGAGQKSRGCVSRTESDSFLQRTKLWREAGLKPLASELGTSGMPQHSPLPWVRKHQKENARCLSVGQQTRAELPSSAGLGQDPGGLSHPGLRLFPDKPVTVFSSALSSTAFFSLLDPSRLRPNPPSPGSEEPQQSHKCTVGC